jgi:hypothetical protein
MVRDAASQAHMNIVRSGCSFGVELRTWACRVEDLSAHLPNIETWFSHRCADLRLESKMTLQKMGSGLGLGLAGRVAGKEVTEKIPVLLHMRPHGKGLGVFACQWLRYSGKQKRDVYVKRQVANAVWMNAYCSAMLSWP